MKQRCSRGTLQTEGCEICGYSDQYLFIYLQSAQFPINKDFKITTTIVLSEFPLYQWITALFFQKCLTKKSLLYVSVAIYLPVAV